MPMSSSQENSMFTTYDFNYSSYKEDCWDTFGVNPRPRWVTTELGGHVRLLLCFFITQYSLDGHDLNFYSVTLSLQCKRT